MTPTQKLREAEKLATKGPWVAETPTLSKQHQDWHISGPDYYVVGSLDFAVETSRDMHFIALTRNSLPSLLDYVEDMAAEIKYNRGESPPQNPLEQATDLARRRFEAAVKGAE